MPSHAASVPAESDLLCESCGYTLNGLPDSGNCPECGTPVAISTIDDGRSPSPFEKSRSLATFLTTTRAIWLSPARFYRATVSRTDSPNAWIFAAIHRLIASIFFATTVGCHAAWLLQTGPFQVMPVYAMPVVAFASLSFVYALLTGITALASWLSSLEGRYWGMRLPIAVVRRGMLFHSANYVPVAIGASVITAGHLILLALKVISPEQSTMYLYLLSAYVVIAAGYLFRAYWVAMRNFMYANR